MTNTLIILAIITVANFLVRKFAAKSAGASSVMGGGVTPNRSASNQPVQPTWWERAAKALQEASGEPVATVTPSATVAAPAVQSKLVKAKRVGQSPVGAASAKAKIQSVTGDRTEPLTVQQAAGQAQAKPASAIDALISSRSNRKLAPIASKDGSVGKRVWTARKLRQGFVAAEILSAPVAFRSTR